MLGQPPRFYSIANFSQIATNNSSANPTSANSSSLRSLSRLADEALQFDLNRNSLGGADHPFYPNPLGLYNDRKFMDIGKTGHVHRANFPRRMGYSPYPPVSPISPFRTGLPMPERMDYQTTPDATNVTNKPTMPMESLGEYCAEILNRDKHYWTDEETSLMLELYEENKDHFNDSKTKKTKIWNVIAGIVNKKLNTSVNAEQCSQKYRNLKAEFFKVSENAEDGGAKKFGVHFQQMKRLLDSEERLPSKVSKQPPTQPPAQPPAQPPVQPSSEWFKEEVLDSNDKSLLTRKQKTTKTDTMSSTDNETAYDFTTLETSESSVSSSVTTPSTNFPIVTTPLELFTANNIEYLKIPCSNKNTPSPSHTMNNFSNEKQDIENCSNNECVETLNKTLSHCEQTDSCDTNSEHDGNCHMTYSEELHNIFHDYFKSRELELEKYIVKQKENIDCMNKCIAVFQHALRSKTSTT